MIRAVNGANRPTVELWESIFNARQCSPSFMREVAWNGGNETETDKSRFTFFEHLTNCHWYEDPSLLMRLIFILMFQSYIKVEVINLPRRDIFIPWRSEMMNFSRAVGERRSFRARNLNLFLNLCKLMLLMHFKSLFHNVFSSYFPNENRNAFFPSGEKRMQRNRLTSQ